ncbi:family 16 glycosylhydrolase [Granulicatella sp. zg-84]|nr:family 16 glycosylhydrolase [Granulicatella sp. zg-84]
MASYLEDETGHDEIDILEYLGQDSWDAWTTNHYGILAKNKGSHGVPTKNYEAWSQAFHVYEVEWSPTHISWYIDGKKVFTSTQGQELDSMHHRPMFPILETQVGDGWVGDVDYSKRLTKQDSNYLIDWIRVYQTEDAPITRFDNLDTPNESTPYHIRPIVKTDGLTFVSHGEQQYENKNNFFYGGQPRYENSRLYVKEGSENQSLIYKVNGVKDVHLTTYYQTLSDVSQYNSRAWANEGASIRSTVVQKDSLDFKIETSLNGKDWTPYQSLRVVDNFVDAYPAYARTTFDAYDLPSGTKYVKVIFPNYKGAMYTLRNGSVQSVKHTDIQLAKVTFLTDNIIDKSDLEALKNKVEALEKDSYISGMEKLEQVLKQAKNVLSLSTATQEDIDDVTKQLEEALGQLIEKKVFMLIDKKVTVTTAKTEKTDDLSFVVKDATEELEKQFDKQVDIYDMYFVSNKTKEKVSFEQEAHVSVMKKDDRKVEQVYFLNGDKKEPIPFTVTDKEILFTVKHFSHYAVVYNEGKTKKPFAIKSEITKSNTVSMSSSLLKNKVSEERKLPKTNEEKSYVGVLIGSLLLGLGCFVFKVKDNRI